MTWGDATGLWTTVVGSSATSSSTRRTSEGSRRGPASVRSSTSARARRRSRRRRTSATSSSGSASCCPKAGAARRGSWTATRSSSPTKPSSTVTTATATGTRSPAGSTRRASTRTSQDRERPLRSRRDSRVCRSSSVRSARRPVAATERSRAASSCSAASPASCASRHPCAPLDDASRVGAVDAERVDLLRGADLPGWTIEGGDWKWSDGVLRASGGPGRLVSVADDWGGGDFELRLRLSVNEKGDARVALLWLRADIQCNPNARTKTGSLIGVRDVETDLVPGGTRFQYVGSFTHDEARLPRSHDLRQRRRGPPRARRGEAPGRRPHRAEIGPETELVVEDFIAQRP